MSDESRYPLTWPEGWPRTPDWKRARSKYSKDFVHDRDAILRRLKSMGATHPILSTNVALRQDGLPLANQRTPSDTGVAVYFTRKSKAHVVACDAWSTVDENLRACLRTLEALAAIERSGSAQIEDRAYAGFARLPSTASSAPHWSVTLGLPNAYRERSLMLPSELLARAKSQYRQLAQTAHPDRGGTHERMAELNAAIAAAEKELG